VSPEIRDMYYRVLKYKHSIPYIQNIKKMWYGTDGVLSQRLWEMIERHIIK
jgi:hypothetical protein